MEPTCLVCGESLKQVHIVTCPRCQTPYHEICWLYAAGCSVFGCDGKGLVSRQDPTQVLSAMTDAIELEDMGRPGVFGRLRRWVDRQLAPIYLTLAGVPAELMSGGILGAIGGSLGTMALFASLLVFMLNPLVAYALFWLGIILLAITPVLPRSPTNQEVTDLISRLGDELPESVQQEFGPLRGKAELGSYMVLSGIIGAIWTGISGRISTGVAMALGIASVSALGVCWSSLQSSTRRKARKRFAYGLATSGSLAISLMVAALLVGTSTACVSGKRA